VKGDLDAPVRAAAIVATPLMLWLRALQVVVPARRLEMSRIDTQAVKQLFGKINTSNAFINHMKIHTFSAKDYLLV
jgi:hypothetical protein